MPVVFNPCQTSKLPQRPPKKGKRRKGRRHPAVRGLVCPRCGSEALYRYGRTVRGNVRFLCQVCGRQFSLDRAVRLPHAERPTCPVCRRSMHVYMRGPGLVRFRCSAYPACRGFAVKRVPPVESH